MTPTNTNYDNTDEHEYTIPMSDKPRAKELAQQAIRNYRKKANPVCNQHSSWSPPPTLEVDRILDRSFRQI